MTSLDFVFIGCFVKKDLNGQSVKLFYIACF